MDDTQRLDYIDNLTAKGHECVIHNNGGDTTVNIFRRTGYGENLREAIDDLIDKMNVTVSERVAKRLTE